MKKNISILMAALALTACGGDDLLENVSPTPTPEPTPDVVQVPVRITADSGAPTAAKTRKVSGTDSGSELTFVWESTDGIEVFAGAQGMTRTVFTTLSSGAGTKSAEFSGTMSYDASANGDAALTDDTPVYSYIRNANLVYNADDRSVTMDLATQTGSLDDALAHTLFWSESTYNGGDIHFKYVNQMAVLKLNIQNVGTESGTGTVTFMADEGMPNSVTCSAKTGAVTPGTGKQVKATAVSFADGAATVYLAIVPNATSAITRSEVRIDINGRTFYQLFKNSSIAAGTLAGGYLYPQSVKKAKELKVGDVLYKDGTWSTKAEAIGHTKSEVLGIVGDINPTDEDVDAGYRHGYALYYEDLPEGKDYDWACEYLINGIACYYRLVSTAFPDISYPQLNIPRQAVLTGADQATVISYLEAEPSGLELSRLLYPLEVRGHVAYQPARYAYGEWGESPEEAATFTHSFLGTAGQMFKILRNLSIVDTTKTFSSTAGSYTDSWKWANQNYTAQQNVALSITCSDGAMAMNLKELGTVSKDYYWTTSEYDKNEAYAFYLQGNEVKFEAEQKTDKKSVRPLVAF